MESHEETAVDPQHHVHKPVSMEFETTVETALLLGFEKKNGVVTEVEVDEVFSL